MFVDNRTMIRRGGRIFAPFKGKPVEHIGKFVHCKTCKRNTPKEAPQHAVDEELGRLPACGRATFRHAGQYQESDR
jgi:hypothetical protein